MSLLDTKEKKKSFTITAAIMVVLLMLFGFVTILRELDPPPEGGIYVNLGFTDTGSGDVQPVEPIKTAPQPRQSPAEPQESTPQVDNTITSETSDAPVIESDPEAQTKPEPQKQPAEKPQPKPEPKPDQNVLDALNSATSGPAYDGTEQNGEGPGDGPGDKGNPDGDRFANTYYGEPGSGSGDKGFGLKGRAKVAGSGVEPDCNETGIVVVEIAVNKQGQVIRARPGKRGTTNSAACLLEAAKQSARTFKFNREPNAPNTQIGFVEVVFKLGE